MPKPSASRATLPADYGLPEDSPLLSWDEVAERVEKALHYWLSTASANGVPIARPIDGMWVANALYFGGDERSRWMRNLRANPNVCLTLQDAADAESAVIMEGTVAMMTPDETACRRARRQRRSEVRVGRAGRRAVPGRNVHVPTAQGAGLDASVSRRYALSLRLSSVRRIAHRR